MRFNAAGDYYVECRVVLLADEGVNGGWFGSKRLTGRGALICEK